MRRLPALLLLPAAGWVAYAWGAHLATPGCIWRGPRGRRCAALTFDDGPDPRFTPRVLEVLDRAGVPGTFFLVGARAARAPGIVREIAAGAHEVASHGWSHRNLWLCGPGRTDAELSRAHDLLGELTGSAPRYFRPPWGAVNLAVFSVLRRLGERCVFWSIQPEGLRPVDARRQAEHVLRRVHSGAIVDLHDAEGTRGAPERLVRALPPMIEGLRGHGYALVTLGGLLAGHTA